MLYRSVKVVATAVLLLVLAACGPLEGPPRTTVIVSGDKFSKQIELAGIPLHMKNGIDLFWMLRSYVNPETRHTDHQIYIEWTYEGGSPGRYVAADDTARPLPVKDIHRESCAFNKCPRTDTLGIAIDEATLRKRAATGFQVKLTGQGDGYSAILDIRSDMITAQLQAEDRILNPPAGMSPQAAIASANARTPDGKPFLGVAPIDLPFGLGVSLQRVDPNTPAQAAGLQEGDMVFTYNGQAITTADQFRKLILQTTPGSVVPIEIGRGTNKMTLSIHM